jgi:hypothetical protein
VSLFYETFFLSFFSESVNEREILAILLPMIKRYALERHPGEGLETGRSARVISHQRLRVSFGMRVQVEKEPIRLLLGKKDCGVVTSRSTCKCQAAVRLRQEAALYVDPIPTRVRKAEFNVFYCPTRYPYTPSSATKLTCH